jgi:hypothetical protein
MGVSTEDLKTYVCANGVRKAKPGTTASRMGCGWRLFINNKGEERKWRVCLSKSDVADHNHSLATRKTFYHNARKPDYEKKRK